VFTLIRHDQDEFAKTLEDVASLVPYRRNEDGALACVSSLDSTDAIRNADEPYSYELAPVFDREKAGRATCGFVGLRNLSNTCYLNSLFTQLFMNTNFRRFILGAMAPVSDGLLFEMQKLFVFMQDSYQRFVDTSHLVQSIKTYDDGPIDIHSQMDVDEFYNLLFDRIEGYLLRSEDRREFRSFYGGQLVQQVSSKECEHISERLEPFSAIQCDIKGKSTLEESLQAYVDGEVMEGGKWTRVLRW